MRRGRGRQLIVATDDDEGQVQRLAGKAGGCVLERRGEVRRQMVRVEDGGAGLERRGYALLEGHAVC